MLSGMKKRRRGDLHLQPEMLVSLATGVSLSFPHRAAATAAAAAVPSPLCLLHRVMDGAKAAID